MDITPETHFDAGLRAQAGTVPRIAFQSREQIESHVRQNRPAIFTGALEHWPARKKWNPEYFRNRWSQRPVSAHETKWEGRAPYLSTTSEHAAKKKLVEYFDSVSSDTDYSLYLYQAEASSAFPGSEEDLDYLSLIDPSPKAPPLRPNVWMGTPGTRSGLHFDPADNLIAMFYGSKAFMLVGPESPSNLYPIRANPMKSPVDPAKVDWGRFPRVRKAHVYIDVLGPGELLFLPRRWWHYLAALELSINATCWFTWNGHQARTKQALPHLDLPYLLRCGPSYPLHFLYQFLWYGMLQRPFYSHALSPPPPGLMMWAHFRRHRNPPRAKASV
jgi:hypothetical protein